MDTLKRFLRMTRRLKPYMPKPRPFPPEPKQEWTVDDPRVVTYPARKPFWGD